MTPPELKPHRPWQPGMLVGFAETVIKPVRANEYFIVNSTRQTIMRALVSSRSEMKGKR